MTDQRSWLSTFTSISQVQGSPVEGIGGVAIFAIGVGHNLINVKTDDGFEVATLTDVLFVSGLGRSLFFLLQCRSEGYLYSAYETWISAYL